MKQTIMRSMAFATCATLLFACTSGNEEPAPVKFSSYSAKQFFETTTISGTSINHDGSAILVHSDKTGIFNAYRYPTDGAEPVQLTHSTEESVWVIDWFPNDDRFLYAQDKGGDELDHVFVQELDGKVVDLTPGDNVKAYFSGWHQDGSHFYVATNERDNKQFDLYRYASDDYQREMVFENKDVMSLNTLSRDGQWLALSKNISNTDDDIYLYNINEQKLVNVSEPDLDASHSAVTFTKDNKSLIYSSDQQGEFRQLFEYVIANGEHKQLSNFKWDARGTMFSPNYGYQVTYINQDAKTVAKIVNTRTGKKVDINGLPPGDVLRVNFSNDEQQMSFMINSDTSPSNLYVYDLSRERLSRLTDSLNPAIDESVLVNSRVVRYESFDGLQIPGLLFKPKQASKDSKVPVLIMIHGGPGGQSRTGYSALRQHLINNGYAIFAANNRGSSGYGKTFYHLDDQKHGEDDLQDIVYAKKYLQTLDWVDSEKIGLIGGSYGGYLTMAGMAFTDEFAVGINIFGVTNWVRTLESIPPYWEAFRKSLYEELGDPATDKERLTRISPLFHADKISNPVLVVQGANDPRVLQIESDEMVAEMEKNGVAVEYVLFDDEGHGFAKKENRISASEAYLKFLQTYLK
ncbi:alpha/beta hydrolase family protein [Thalassotalea sp. HSM 43]|uniref:alpha/beta hydrolase family protein n=1 Tax=Thalassotalea sp. HSM 43 TaxID=2552945 RepID=UPI001E5D5241|nr:S9 family peptidase [Thalassotalea sp. HSM 43]